MERLSDPVTRFEALGGLHDAAVEWISWDAPDEFRLVVDNLNANFMDGVEPSPDYPGHVARRATIVFQGVHGFSGHMRDNASGISEIRLQRADRSFDVQIIGKETWVFMFSCGCVALEPAQEPSSVSRRYEKLNQHR